MVVDQHKLGANASPINHQKLLRKSNRMRHDTPGATGDLTSALHFIIQPFIPPIVRKPLPMGASILNRSSTTIETHALSSNTSGTAGETSCACSQATGTGTLTYNARTWRSRTTTFAIAKTHHGLNFGEQPCETFRFRISGFRISGFFGFFFDFCWGCGASAKASPHAPISWHFLPVIIKSIDLRNLPVPV